MRVLKLGDQGKEVKTLQIILNILNYKVSEVGPGSPLNETDKCGALTKQALTKLQKENNIIPADGSFNPETKAVVLKKLVELLEQLKAQLGKTNNI